MTVMLNFWFKATLYIRNDIEKNSSEYKMPGVPFSGTNLRNLSNLFQWVTIFKIQHKSKNCSWQGSQVFINSILHARFFHRDRFTRCYHRSFVFSVLWYYASLIACIEGQRSLIVAKFSLGRLGSASLPRNGDREEHRCTRTSRQWCDAKASRRVARIGC